MCFRGYAWLFAVFINYENALIEFFMSLMLFLRAALSVSVFSLLINTASSYA
jgi:hypothetical protein